MARGTNSLEADIMRPYGVIINNRNNVALINTEISGFHSGGVSLGNFGMEDLKDGSVALIALFLTTQ